MTEDGAWFNPFTEMVAGQYFVGREDSLEVFRNRLGGLRQQVPGHLYVAGLHGTGKTSFLARLKEIAVEGGFSATLSNLDQDRSARDNGHTILKSVIRALDELLSAKGQPLNLMSDWERGIQGLPSTHFTLCRLAKLESDALRTDLLHLQRLIHDAGKPGCVICIDEGQRIEPQALSAVKNAMQHLTGYMVVLSLRLVSDAGGPVEAGLNLLTEKAAKAEGDFGAVRFFSTGLAMGPFGSDEEATDCIRRRLKGNAVQFDDDAIACIIRFTGRLPRSIINFSGHLWDDVAKTKCRVASLNMVHMTFRRVYPSEMAEAQEVVSRLSATAKVALRGLLSLRSDAEPMAVAMRAYPSLPEVSRDAVCQGVGADLQLISDTSRICVKVGTKYAVADPLKAFALELELA